MQHTLLLSKIHNCFITKANLDYVGSISIDNTLLKASGILPYEQVHVVNCTNGNRLITYCLPAPSNTGAIELNGAAARLGMPGDCLIVMSYAKFTSEDLKDYSPTVVFVDRQNVLVKAKKMSNSERLYLCNKDK